MLKAKEFQVTCPGEWLADNLAERPALLHAMSRAEIGVAFSMKLKSPALVPTGVVLYTKKQVLCPPGTSHTFQ